MTRDELTTCREILNDEAEIAAELGNMAQALHYLKGALVLAYTPPNSTPMEVTRDAQRRVMLRRTIRAIEASMSRVNLSGGYLAGANLSDGHLSGVNLSGRPLSGVNLTVYPDE